MRIFFHFTLTFFACMNKNNISCLTPGIFLLVLLCMFCVDPFPLCPFVKYADLSQRVYLSLIMCNY